MFKDHYASIIMQNVLLWVNLLRVQGPLCIHNHGIDNAKFFAIGKFTACLRTIIMHP